MYVEVFDNKLVIHMATKIIETIGGGRVEYQAILDARNEEGVRSHLYELSNKEGAKLGMICGGRNDVLFIPLK